MKPSLSKETWQAVYDRLNQVNPVGFDCGIICGAACCDVSQPYLGMYLLPGEEQVHNQNDGWLQWTEEPVEPDYHPASWDGTVWFVRCQGPEHCNREKRPIQCRTFPLLPHLTDDNRLQLIFNDLELSYYCPLLGQSSKLQPDFIEETWHAWNTLIQDPLIYDYVKQDSTDRLADPDAYFEVVKG